MNKESTCTVEGRNVIIFRDNLLAYSETFIPAQAEKFEHFVPIYTGLRRVKGIKLPEDRTVVARTHPIARLPGWGRIFGQMDPWFKNKLREFKPALIHAHFEDCGVIAVPLSASLNVPLIVTCHGNDVTAAAAGGQRRSSREDYKTQREEMFQKAAAFIGISRFICDQMLRKGYPRDKIRLHYIGVDVDRFQPDPSAPKQPVILYVGRLVPKKGCADLLRAMKKVNARYPEIKLKLCGSGPLLDELQSFARDERINVEFCGIQTPEAIQKMLQSALISCIPSVRAEDGDSEGLGIVNLEAQACGVPVVGTNHGGIPESVEDQVTGLLSPERDPDALAENILALLSDAALREKMGSAGRQRMLQRFNLKHQSSILEKMYHEFI
jgi:glycosyltransferase involved in cell wall biosynthesis